MTQSSNEEQIKWLLAKRDNILYFGIFKKIFFLNLTSMHRLNHPNLSWRILLLINLLLLASEVGHLGIFEWQQNKAPHLRMFDRFNRHQFRVLKLSKLLADMVLYGWLKFWTR